MFENIIKNEAKEQRMCFYELPQSRAPFVLYNRVERTNSDSGSILEDPSLVPQDIYGDIIPVNDCVDKGSCDDYNDRVDVTQEVIDNEMSAQQVMQHFGCEKFVIASMYFK